MYLDDSISKICKQQYQILLVLNQKLSSFQKMFNKLIIWIILVY